MINARRVDFRDLALDAPQRPALTLRNRNG
jgi:hypothetical protein